MKRHASLAAYLKATGRTQEDFAKEFGIRQGTLSRWVRGISMPRVHTAIRLHELTGVPLEALIRAKAAQQDVA